ncbi:MAG: acetyl-CoA hydrolase/transferase family protein [Verrucomicrobiota bacterium]
MSTTAAPTVSTFPKLAAEEAAAFVHHGETVGFSGFTPAGAPKVVPTAIAGLAKEEHAAGRDYKIGVVTGASTGASLDGALAEADAVAFRTPYQSDPLLRKRINAGQARFFDLHLSLLPQNVRYGFLGPVHVAVVEASNVSADGQITLTSSVGTSPTFCQLADKVIVELNRHHPPELLGFHDVYEPASPPHRREIPIYSASDRVGTPTIQVDPAKIVGVVENDAPDEVGAFAETDEVTKQIGRNVADFLAAEIKSGLIPAEFLPIQSGVGNIANAVLGEMGEHPDIPPFEMYTEVIQNSVISLIQNGKIKFASGCSLTVTPDVLATIYADLEAYRSKLLLRPQEITNHPELVRRLGIISINTAIEVDIFGNANSTHVMGRSMMNGIGGSGDFTRNAYLSIFTCPAAVKGGKISTIVPAVSHQDHNEHSVQVIITDQGVADLRGKSPKERARTIVDQCADPSYRDQLHGYFDRLPDTHTPQTLSAAFAFHEQFMATGDMRGVDWGQHFKN